MPVGIAPYNLPYLETVWDGTEIIRHVKNIAAVMTLSEATTTGDGPLPISCERTPRKHTMPRGKRWRISVRPIHLNRTNGNDRLRNEVPGECYLQSCCIDAD